MSDIEGIVKFFKEVQLSNSSILQYRQVSMKNIWRCKMELIRATKSYKFDNIIFFHTEFGGVINWFLIRESKSTQILFCKVFDRMPYPKACGLKAFKYWLRTFLLTGVNVEVLDRGFSYVPTLRSSFYSKIGASDYVIKIDNKLIKKFLDGLNLGMNESAKVLLLTGSTVASGIVNEQEYISKTNILIEAIGKNRIIAKCHPRFDDVFGKEKELFSLPRHIPGNLIIDSFDIFIGNHSTLLAEAAIAGKLSISLIDYYKQTNPEQANGFKTLFMNRLNGRGVIHFPTSIIEILKLINSKQLN